MEEEKYSKSKASMFLNRKLVLTNSYKKLYYYDSRFIQLFPYINLSWSPVPRYETKNDNGYFIVGIGWICFHIQIYLKGRW